MDLTVFSTFVYFMTICLALVSVINGVIINQFGVSLVHLAYMYQTNIGKMSFAVTCATLGAATGSALCGRFLRIFNQEIAIFVTFGLTGVLTIMLPWMPSLNTFFLCTYSRGIPRGFMWQAVQANLLNTWSGSLYKPFVIQSAITLGIFGAVVTPFIIGPFLSELPSETTEKFSGENTTLFGNLSDGFDTHIKNNSLNLNNNTFLGNDSYSFLQHQNNSYKLDLSAESGRLNIAYEIQVPFMLTGSAVVILSFVFLLIYYILKTCSKAAYMDVKYLELQQHHSGQKKKPGQKVFVMAMCASIIVLMYIGQSAMSFLISAFVIKGLHWPVYTGPQITSVLMLAKMFGSIFASILAIKIPASILVFGQAILTFLGYLLTGIGTTTNVAMVVWFGVALTGFGTCSSQATLIVWITSRMHLTELDLTVVQLSVLTGRSIAPSLGGFLFQHFSPISFIYMGVTATSLQTLTFTVLYIYVRFCYVKEQQQNNDEIESDLS